MLLDVRAIDVTKRTTQPIAATLSLVFCYFDTCTVVTNAAFTTPSLVPLTRVCPTTRIPRKKFWDVSPTTGTTRTCDSKKRPKWMKTEQDIGTDGENAREKREKRKEGSRREVKKRRRWWRGEIEEKGTATTPVAFDFREESEGHRHRPANRPGVPTRKTTPVVCSTADGPSNPIAHVLSRHGYRDRYALTAAAVVAVHGTLRVARTFVRSKYVEVQSYMKKIKDFSRLLRATLVASVSTPLSAPPLALMKVWANSRMLMRYEQSGKQGVRRRKTMPRGWHPVCGLTWARSANSGDYLAYSFLTLQLNSVSRFTHNK